MAINVSYVARESFNNMRRNLLMTSAALLTIVISLTLVGAALLFRGAVSNATATFKKGFDVTVFMQPEATKSQVEAVRKELTDMPELSKVEYVNKDESFKDSQRLFRNYPELAQGIPTPADAPEQFRIKPKDPDQIAVIGERFRNRQGVFSVAYLKNIKKIVDLADGIQLAILGTAVFLLISAVVLILNTIRMAIFARRREVSVMKLVGATNSFIRLPFMVEGLFQGVLGALISILILAVGANRAKSYLSGGYAMFKALSLSSGQVFSTSLYILAIGAIVGTLGSALAVSRFLDV